MIYALLANDVEVHSITIISDWKVVPRVSLLYTAVCAKSVILHGSLQGALHLIKISSAKSWHEGESEDKLF